jgi:mannose-6-phosphate isomerase-like protein (cupin superfamily)
MAAAGKPDVRAPRVIRACDVAPFSPKGAEGDYQSRLLVDDESAGSRNLVVNLFTLMPGKSTYPGTHPPPYDEVYYILRGRGILTLGNPTAPKHEAPKHEAPKHEAPKHETPKHDVGPDTLAFIPAGTVHQLENTGSEPLDMLTMMPHLPVPGVNTLYDARKREWGTSFRLLAPGGEGGPRNEEDHQ